MKTAILDRVVIHADNGTILITRDRLGRYYLEARATSRAVHHNKGGGEKVVVRLDPDIIDGDEGLLDQLARFAGQDADRRKRAKDTRPPEPFSAVLMRAMDEAQITVKELAMALGVTDAAVYFWRTGQTRPRRRHVARLARILLVRETDIVAALDHDTCGKDGRKRAA